MVGGGGGAENATMEHAGVDKFVKEGVEKQ